MKRGTALIEGSTWVEIEDRDDESGDSDFEVEAHFLFTPFDPGRSIGPAEDCYPPEGGEVQECSLTLPDGRKIDNGEDWLRDRLGNLKYDLVEEAAYEDALNSDWR